jgi:transposase
MQVDAHKFIGLDVHKKSIAIAVAEGGPYDEIHELGIIPHDLTRLLRKLEPLGGPARLHVAYEAGPTGYGLARALKERGIECVVVAPSKTPQRTGDRVKTDRRDAVKLARFLRSNELIPIEQPSRQREALRDLVRAREDVMHAQHKARQQLQSFLLRHGRIWGQKSNWTSPHLQWIRSQRFEFAPQQEVLEDYFQEVARISERLAHLTARLEHHILASEKDAPLFRALQSLRGVSVIVAATVLVELGDLARFPTAAKLMSYLGLTPSEHSSGASVQRGSITKAGNPHGRRVFVEAAWSSRLDPKLSLKMKRRCEGLSPGVIAIADKARRRQHKRFWYLVQRGKSQQTAVVACARELVGFVWAIARQVRREAHASI